MNAVAEIVKAIAWPIAVIILAFGYKPELLSFVFPALRRKLKIEIPGGIKLEIDAAEQQQTAADLIKIDEDSSTITLKEIPGLTRTSAIGKLELALHAQLKNVTADPIDVLVRNLAQARLEAAFGFIYAGIFGSQIAGLIQLEARRKVSTDEAFQFYSEVEKRYPEIYEGYGFPGWLRFLVNHGMVVHVETDIMITDLGDDFLQWLRATKLSINKPW